MLIHPDRQRYDTRFERRRYRSTVLFEFFVPPTWKLHESNRVTRRGGIEDQYVVIWAVGTTND
jgi:hypothetical protein